METDPVVDFTFAVVVMHGISVLNLLFTRKMKYLLAFPAAASIKIGIT